ncbi:MAG: PAS domain S-box protein [Spirochaetales bacterium]|uniref:PAS domain S-box protein n=1 Tax=Candidatus Thalassospirochaeta sargassi TaxID=3119039 RepID=A0AAJ1IJ93_9SPIO|nr:PAS domain S-box protein [Spirochaetales bacterium]
MINNWDFYLKIFENSSEGLFLINESGRIKFVNERCTELTGWDINKILENQESFLGFFRFDNGSALEHTVEIPVDSGGSLKLKYSFVRQGGDEKSILVNIEPYETGEITPWSGDISKHLFNNLPDPVVSFDLKGDVLGFNPAVTKLTGWNPDKLKNASLLYADDKAFLYRVRELIISRKQLRQEVEIVCSNGKKLRFSETLWPHFDTKFELSGFTAYYQDLSREELLKAQLRASQTNYNRLFENFASSIVIVDELGNVVNMNSAAEELYGWSRDELLGVSYDEYFSAGKGRPDIQELIRLAVQNGGKYIEIGVPRNNKSREKLYTYVTYYIIDLSGEGMFALFVLEKDLTTRVRLEKQLEDSVYQVKETQAAAIMGFAKLTEFRDHCTGEHLDRIKLYTRALAAALKNRPEYINYINDAYIDDLAMSSILHDIGKVGIEDSILLKSGKLSKEEFDVMKKHSTMGGDALAIIDNNLGYKSFLTIGKEVASYHHERWDGSGYPEGLRGKDIPLSARIVALADVYDALISERPYKKPFSHEEATKLIVAEKGTHFDPDVVDAFLYCSEEFKKISETMIEADGC